jgi:hypothetical protein
VLRALSSAQTQRPTFSAEVEVVNVFVTVRDKKGGIVRDLAKEEFSQSEDGRPQTLQSFSRESGLPLTIGLLVDTTPSESNMLDVERTASLAFLDHMLRPEKDAAFVVQYHSKIELLQGVTSMRKELAKRTGGACFEVGKKQTLEQIYGQIEEELRSQYNLGYTPDANAVPGYRSIKVGVTRKGILARGREGCCRCAKSQQ